MGIDPGKAGFIAAFFEDKYYFFDMPYHKVETEEKTTDQDEEYDEKYDEAVQLVAKDRQASISYIQRRLRIGYNRAARIIEMMEKDGVVGPSDGVKSREVYVKPILFE